MIDTGKYAMFGHLEVVPIDSDIEEFVRPPIEIVPASPLCPVVHTSSGKNYCIAIRDLSKTQNGEKEYIWSNDRVWEVGQSASVNETQQTLKEFLEQKIQFGCDTSIESAEASLQMHAGFSENRDAAEYTWRSPALT